MDKFFEFSFSLVPAPAIDRLIIAHLSFRTSAASEESAHEPVAGECPLKKKCVLFLVPAPIINRPAIDRQSSTDRLCGNVR